MCMCRACLAERVFESCVALLILVEHFLSIFVRFCFYDVDAVVVVVAVIIGAVKWWNVGAK